MAQRTKLQPEQILSIYTRYNAGQSLAQIAEDDGLRLGLVYHVHKLFLKYVEHPKTLKRKNKRFLAAKALLNKNAKYSVVEAPMQFHPNTDPFEALSSAEKVFQEALVTFIDAMVNQRCEALIKENEELKRVRDAAKMNNWVFNLKNRYQK